MTPQEIITRTEQSIRAREEQLDRLTRQEIITRTEQNIRARKEQLDRLTRQHQTLIRALVRLMDETAGKSTTLVEWDNVMTLMDDAMFFAKNIRKGIERLS